MARTKASERARRDARRDAVGRALTAMNLLRPHVIRARAANRIGRAWRAHRFRGTTRSVFNLARSAVSLGIRRNIADALRRHVSAAERRAAILHYNQTHLIPWGGPDPNHDYFN